MNWTPLVIAVIIIAVVSAAALLGIIIFNIYQNIKEIKKLGKSKGFKAPLDRNFYG